jgi:prolyl oligopeptidase
MAPSRLKRSWSLRLGASLAIGTWSLVILLSGCHSGFLRRSAYPAMYLYPATAKTNIVENLHGTQVADPYRWLEDDNAPATKAWVEAQNKVTFGYLESIPQRGAIRERITKLWNYERYGVPFKEGGRYFFTRNDGLQNQSVLYVTESLDAEPRVLLDPNQLSAEGTIALSSYSISDDGNLMAYGLSTAGSDWQEWKVRDVRTGRDLEDHLQWVKFSGASWAADGSGFFYSRYDAPKEGEKLTGQNYFQKLYFHRVGTPQSEDVLVYHRPDQKEWGFSGSVTEDGRYLVIHIWKGTERKNRVFFKDLQTPGAEVVELLNDFDAQYSFVGNVGATFYFETDWQATRGRLIAIDTAQPARAHWREIIPEAAETLESVSFVNDQFVAEYLKDARAQVKVFARAGGFVREVELPGLGTVGGFRGKRADTETFYVFTSYTTPGTIYRHDLKTGASTVFKRPQVDFNPADFETKQVFYASKDGTRIPMFITHRRGVKLDGNNPTVLYGYGGFKISLTPSFSPTLIAWLEMGGVYAIPNLRGGGEYGEAWHQAGVKANKQNVFDDFIAAAEWLCGRSANVGQASSLSHTSDSDKVSETGRMPVLRVDPPQRYTRPAKLAISGGSNGGLLVGACMTQRPDLFGACLPAVGVMDMLRFHKFTIGWAWTSDYGSADNADEFRHLYAYSPLHNLRPGVKYPSTMVTTADHDDRVVPAHSFKFAARLQECHAGNNPVLIRIETKAGHGAGKPTAKLIEEAADKWAFLVRELGVR